MIFLLDEELVDFFEEVMLGGEHVLDEGEAVLVAHGLKDRVGRPRLEQYFQVVHHLLLRQQLQ